MKRKAVGFYWTLPVPWLGFTKLPDDIDEAATKSRTIRYQRDAIRRHAKENGFDLIHEAAFLEIEPDRGTELIEGPLKRVAPICQQHDAVLLYVDFSKEQGWRSHAPLHNYADQLGLRLEPVWPSALPIEGEPSFDPAAHFARWRERQREWTDTKPARAAEARTRALALRGNGLKNPAIADQLNAERLLSPTGKPWTADGVRKFLAPSG